MDVKIGDGAGINPGLWKLCTLAKTEFGQVVVSGSTEDVIKAAYNVLMAGTDTMPKSDNYDTLRNVLLRAYDQAAERHGQGLPFTEQPMQRLCDLYGRGFALGQAAKKMQEAQRLDNHAAVRELLGAINYIAGAIIHLEAHQ